MSLFKNITTIVAALLLAACGSNAHVRADGCVIHGDTLTARLSNASDKPIVRAEIQVDFYYNYRFSRGTAESYLMPVLDPGTSREVQFPLGIPHDTGAQPMRCTVSRAFYGDGTLESF